MLLKFTSYFYYITFTQGIFLITNIILISNQIFFIKYHIYLYGILYCNHLIYSHIKYKLMMHLGGLKVKDDVIMFLKKFHITHWAQQLHITH